MSFTSGDICKVDLHWQVGNIGIAANVFQCRLQQVTPHTRSDGDVVSDMALWMHNILLPIAPHVVVNVEATGCSVYKKVGPLYNLVGEVPVDFTPGSAGDPLPSGVAALVTAYTAISKVVGKKYLPGLSEVAQTAGLWVAGVLIAMAEMGVAWVAGFETIGDEDGTWYPGVWSLKEAGFVAFSSAGMARDVPAYQRRRKAGVGA